MTIFGGSGADTITADYNVASTIAPLGINDIILGDDGEADFTAGVLVLVKSTHTDDGGDDTIVAGNGNDIVFGGLGADHITLGNGTDAVLGDSGEAQLSNAGVLQVVFDLSPEIIPNTANPAIGTTDNDTIIVGDGNDVVIGGSGADTITAGNGSDYVLGDNGNVQYVQVNGLNMVNRAQSTDWFYGAGDTISVGNGVDSIIGGDGNDTITAGNGNDDLIIGDNGQIVQAFNADNSLRLNSDGNLHRDIVLEEAATITGAVALDTQSDAALSNLASITSADLVLLAGAFNADGSQLISQTTGAWETQALLLSLVADGNDTITVGSGNDVIIGQGGNNTINANGGNDIIFGNAASNTSPVASDIPWIVNAVVIASTSGDAQIALPVAGQIVVPSVNLLPSALTPNMPQLEMAPQGFGALGGLAQGGTLALGASSAHLSIFASVVPGLLNGSHALPGSNIINGGNGNDTIFGNYGVIGALPTTGISAIDAQLQGLSVTMMGLVTQFSALSTAEDALNVAKGTPTSPNLIAAENNVITVGNGNDTIFGNVGEYLIPDVAFAQGSGSLASNAVALDTYLLDMQEVVAEMSYVAHEAGQQAINAFGAIANPAASSHLIDIGNDTITITGSGSNLVVGDNGIVLMPGVGTTTSNWATGVASGDAFVGAVAALAAGVRLRCDDWRRSLRPTIRSRPATAPRRSRCSTRHSNFTFVIGNDTINGGSGNSILIGDDGLILDPVIAPGQNGAANATALQALMVADVDRLFLGPYSAAAATAESWGVSTNLGADRLVQRRRIYLQCRQQGRHHDRQRHDQCRQWQRAYLRRSRRGVAATRLGDGTGHGVRRLSVRRAGPNRHVELQLRLWIWSVRIAASVGVPSGRPVDLRGRRRCDHWRRGQQRHVRRRRRRQHHRRLRQRADFRRVRLQHRVGRRRHQSDRLQPQHRHLCLGRRQ